LPFPPSVDVTLVVVFSLVLGVADVPVTLTEKVHEPPAAKVAVVGDPKLMVEVPAVAVIVPPPQLPLKPLGVDMTSPEGRLSVKLIPFSAVVGLGLVTVKLNEV
jgi:hypothetical protein